MGYREVLARGAELEAARIEAWDADAVAALPHRETMRAVKALVAVFCAPESGRRHDAALLAAARPLLAHLASRQRADGLFDSENLQSPPDTCFTITDLCITASIARAHPHAALEPVVAELRGIAGSAVDALVTGGVHTPNHRWELAAALVRLDALWPDPRLRSRAEEWLAEGVDAHPDGHYSERSANYAAHVTNPSLLAIADHLDRPELVDVVRRNLRAVRLLLEDDLTVETVHSRRQDQHERWDGRAFLSQFRRIAVRDADASSAAVVRAILERGVVAPAEHLAEALLDPRLTEETAVGAPAPDDGHHVFPSSGLARLRAGRATASVFGGSDHARFARIASGLANSSTLLRMRHGAAVVDAVRLSPSFFGLGAFRGDGLTVDAPGRYRLAQHWSAGYYQPLPPGGIRADGDYDLGGEGRFFAAMSFADRAVTPVVLDTSVDIRLDPDPEPDGDGRGDDAHGGLGAELDLRFAGADTSWTLEVVLRPGGSFEPGAELRVLGDDRYELVSGTARYRIAGDVVEIGPGNGTGPRRPPVFDPGEAVEYVGGSDTVPGVVVCITGRTSSPYRLRMRVGGLPSPAPTARPHHDEEIA